jgi:hypothetical protein
LFCSGARETARMRWLVLVLLLANCSEGRPTSTTVSVEHQALVDDMTLAFQVDAAWDGLTGTEQREACAASDPELRRRLLPVVGVDDLELALELIRDHC